MKGVKVIVIAILSISVIALVFPAIGVVFSALFLASLPGTIMESFSIGLAINVVVSLAFLVVKKIVLSLPSPWQHKNAKAKSKDLM